MHTFPKSARLLHRLEFRRTLDDGYKTVCPKLVLFSRQRQSTASDDVASLTAQGPGLRLGLIVSRKVGNAVVRNRVKRHLRESFRHMRAELGAAGTEPNLDLVIIARADAASVDSAGMDAALRHCWQRMQKARDARSSPRATPQ